MDNQIYPNISSLNNLNQQIWDSSKDIVNLREDIKWLENDTNKKIIYEGMLKWITKAPMLTTIDNETNFVNPQILKDVMEAKHIFDEYNIIEVSKARARANVFETLRNVFFMNRAALKMANIDAITDFMFTSLDYNSIHKKQDGSYYFADVCAGPGGFTEYILWRKKWCYKGFGFTLRGDNDFKLYESTCISPNSFHGYYGSNDDGNIYNPDNINDFKEVILHQTQGVGVHFMMSDGGFSVEGNEGIQEILSKQLYVCQCYMALEIVRKNGYFVTKLFDLFTAFSVGLIYLMHLCFDSIAIIKPNTSRPANSERYLICKGLKNSSQTTEIKKFLKEIVNQLWLLKQSDEQCDILELVPLSVLQQDSKFMKYIVESNTSIGERQKRGLQKLKKFCENPNLIDIRQETYRSKCLALWQIPDKKRSPNQIYTIDDVLATISEPMFLLAQPREICNTAALKNIIKDTDDWEVTSLASSEDVNCCYIFVGTHNSKVYKMVDHKWVKVKNLRLNKGTVLYGEMIKEKCVCMRDGAETEKFSLHVIDALKLGETSLADLPFKERAKCINIFCEAINFEATKSDIRIRQKMIKPLNVLNLENIVQYNENKQEYITHLSILGPKISDEYHPVNSLLFMKTNHCQTFNSTYILRAQIYVNQLEISEDVFTLVSIIDYLKTLNT